MEIYLPTVFNVAAAATNPTTATALETVMCQVLSLSLPEDHETRIVTAPAIKYGGQVKTNVIVVLKFSVFTTEGNWLQVSHYPHLLWTIIGRDI